MIGAANRDPRRYTDPSSLRLDRDEGRHLSFATGIHACLGAALARIELRHGISALLRRCGDYRLVTDSITWRQHAMLRSPESMRIIPHDRS